MPVVGKHPGCKLLIRVAQILLARITDLFSVEGWMWAKASTKI